MFGESDFSDKLLAREKIYSLQGKREEQAAAVDELLTLVSRLTAGNETTQKRAEVALCQSNLFEVTDDYPCAITAAQEALHLAHQLGDTSLAARAYLQWGRCLWRQGAYKDADAQLEQALSCARATGQLQIEAESLRNLGTVAYYHNDYQQAGEHFVQALRISQRIGDRKGESQALNNLGVVSVKQGDLEQAQAHFDRALAVYREIGERWSEGMALNNLGQIALDRGDLQAEASAYFLQVLQLSREIGNQQGEALALSNLGSAACRRGEYDKAQKYLEQSLSIRQEIGDRRGEAVVRRHLGHLFMMLGGYETAETHLDQALQIYRAIDSQQGEVETLASLGLLSHFLNENERGLAYGRAALTLAEKIDNSLQEGFVWLCQGHSLYALTRLDEAATAYKRALTVQRASGQIHLLLESLSGLARTAFQEQNHATARVCIDEILALIELGALEGVAHPAPIGLVCYQYLRDMHDERALIILTAVYDLLQRRATTLKDKSLRDAYWHRVDANRQIQDLWRGQ